MDRTAHFYAQPSYARGGGLPIYSGSRRQRGGNVLGALKSFFMPLLGSLGRRGAQEALGLTKDVVVDMVRGNNFKDSLKKHGISRAKNLGSEVLGSVMGRASSMLSSASPRTRKRGPKRKRSGQRKARQSVKRHKANF